MKEQTVRYYMLSPMMANRFSEYACDIIHSFIAGEYVYAMIDMPGSHPLAIVFAGCGISQDNYWEIYCKENPLLHITGTPKVVNGEPMVSLQFLFQNLTEILRVTGPISLKNGSYIDIKSDQTISIVSISTEFITSIKQEMSVDKFKKIQKVLLNSKDIIIHAYDEALRNNYQILNAKYELKI